MSENKACQDQTPNLDDLPSRFSGPAAWLGPDMMTREDEWLFRLSPTDVADLENATRHYLSLGRDIGEITADEFPLSTFAQHLNSLQQKLLQGCGFEVLRGLPVESYNQEFAAALFCGIGAHLGSARSQNAKGHILGHVRDIGVDADNPTSRIYQTSRRQTFHTDSTDVVGLMCLSEAREGGESLLVSALSIFNRMQAERPDLLTKLFEPIATDRRSEIPEGAGPYMEIPRLAGTPVISQCFTTASISTARSGLKTPCTSPLNISRRWTSSTPWPTARN